MIRDKSSPALFGHRTIFLFQKGNLHLVEMTYFDADAFVEESFQPCQFEIAFGAVVLPVASVEWAGYRMLQR